MVTCTGKSPAGVRQLVTFRLGDEEFGLDVTSVREIAETPQMSHIPGAPPFVRGAANLRGRILPIVDLVEKLKIPSQHRQVGGPAIVVVEIAGQAVGLLVDGVPRVVRIPTARIGPAPALILRGGEQHYITGVARLEDRPVILLDMNRVLGPVELEEVGRAGSKTSGEERG